jgi:hypothetical protein
MFESGAVAKAKNDYVDPKGYWISPDRTVRRLGDKHGEQTVILPLHRNVPTQSGNECTRHWPRA